MPENSIKENDTIFYYLDSFGKVHYGINNNYAGIFMSGIDIYNRDTQQAQPLWTVIDVYGNTLAIQLSNLQPISPKISSNKENYRDLDQLNSIGRRLFWFLIIT